MYICHTFQIFSLYALLSLLSTLNQPTSMGLLQAPQMGMPILSWQRRQYSSLSSCAV